MTATQPRRSSGLLAAAHLGQAALLLVQPSSIIGRVAGDQDVPPAWIMRVLGARNLLQTVPEVVSPNRNLLRLGVLVDSLHAVSMLMAARIWPHYRRAALTSAVGAGVVAVAGALIVREP